MEFFIRRYLKGLKGSGTSDVFLAKNPISKTEFESICSEIGEGKYNLCVRGKGIRGFKKLSDCIIEEQKLVFATDEIVSVNQNLHLSELSNAEIMGLMGNMISNAPVDAIGQQKFLGDLQTFHAELESRQTHNTAPPEIRMNSEDSIVGAGFSIGKSLPSFALGVVAGGVLVYLMNKSTIDSLKEQVEQLNGSIKDAEESLNKIQKRAEGVNGSFNFHQKMLSDYNRTNGFGNY